VRHALLAALCCAGLSAADVTRDALDRVTRVAYPDGSRMDYAYDAGGNVLSAKYAPPASPPTPGMSFSVSGSGTATPAISGTAPAGTVSVRVFVDGAQVGSATPAADLAWTFSLAGLGPGPHSVSVAALDAAGNVLATSASSSVTLPGSYGGGGGGGSGSSSGGGGGGGGGCGAGAAAALLLAAFVASLGLRPRKSRGPSP
jgi:YD repeat-containing protein